MLGAVALFLRDGQHVAVQPNEIQQRCRWPETNYRHWPTILPRVHTGPRPIARRNLEVLFLRPPTNRTPWVHTSRTFQMYFVKRKVLPSDFFFFSSVHVQLSKVVFHRLPLCLCLAVPVSLASPTVPAFLKPSSCSSGPCVETAGNKVQATARATAFLPPAQAPQDCPPA